MAGTEVAVELGTGTEHVVQQVDDTEHVVGKVDDTEHGAVLVLHGAVHGVQMVSPSVQLLLLSVGCRL